MCKIKMWLITLQILLRLDVWIAWHHWKKEVRWMRPTCCGSRASSFRKHLVKVWMKHFTILLPSARFRIDLTDTHTHWTQQAEIMFKHWKPEHTCRKSAAPTWRCHGQPVGWSSAARSLWSERHKLHDWKFYYFFLNYYLFLFTFFWNRNVTLTTRCRCCSIF